MKGIGSVQRALLLAVVALGLVIGGYFSFRHTLLADIQEAIIAPDTADPLVYGATLFQTRGCSGCHTLAAAGARGDEGPNLDAIGSQHDKAYIRQSIVNPNAVIALDCPEGACARNVMPQFGQILNDDQVEALVAYLASQR